MGEKQKKKSSKQKGNGTTQTDPIEIRKKGVQANAF